MTEEKKPSSVRAIALTLIFSTVAGLALFGFPGDNTHKKPAYTVFDLFKSKR